MDRSHSLKLVGAQGSPYSRKMRAVLRYRRIPFRWIVRGSSEDVGIPEVPVALIPVLVFAGEDGGPDTAMIDSTPQIRRLEATHVERSVIPPDPVMAFLDALLEDYADEWLTKAMFHYRWSFHPDIEKARAILPLWARIDAPQDQVAPLADMFVARQIGRLGLVGSNETTKPVIEESYRRLLQILDAHLHAQPFVMGRRPGSADFGLFGQLSQLALFDPTPAAVALELAPRAVAWCDLVEDLSGLEPSASDWITRTAVPHTLRALLAEVGRIYVPFLLANAAALDRGDEQVECAIDGRKWAQRSFRYQGKCLRRLREAYTALTQEDRNAVVEILAGTGCEPLLNAG